MGLNVFAAQGRQAAGALAYVPAGQESAAKAQVVAFATLYASVSQRVQEGAPLPLNVPAGQAKQVEEVFAPCALLNAPGAQAVQVGEPGALQEPCGQQMPEVPRLYVERAQGEQLGALARLNVPAGQERHCANVDAFA
jgi:hypothetical protein